MPAIEPGPSLFHPVLLYDSNLIPSQDVNSNYMQYRDVLFLFFCSVFLYHYHYDSNLHRVSILIKCSIADF